MNCGNCIREEDSRELDFSTDSVNNLLKSEEQRSKFKIFLKENDATEQFDHVEFWECCENFIEKYSNGNEITKEERKMLEDLLEFADDKINFDLHQLKIFSSIVTEKNKEKVVVTLKEIQKPVSEQLTEPFNKYVQFLRNQKL